MTSPKPVHIMKLAVKDLRGSTIRKRALRIGRPSLWFFYCELLWALHDAGGRLSSDPLALVEEVDFWSASEITDMLPLLAPVPGKRGGIVVDGDVIRNPRVNEGLAEAYEMSARQSDKARSRWSGVPSPDAAAVPVHAAASGSDADAMPSVAVASAVAVAKPMPVPEPAPDVRVRLREDYVRSVASEFYRRRGSELPELAHADVALAQAWFDAGVPLRIVLRGLADCSGAKDNTPRSLRYYGPAVDEAVARWRKATA